MNRRKFLKGLLGFGAVTLAPVTLAKTIGGGSSNKPLPDNDGLTPGKIKELQALLDAHDVPSENQYVVVTEEQFGEIGQYEGFKWIVTDQFPTS